MKYPVRSKSESGTQFKKRRIAWEKQHGKNKVKYWTSEDKTFAKKRKPDLIEALDIRDVGIKKLAEKKAPKFISKDAEMAGIPPQLRTKLPRTKNGLIDHSQMLKPVFNEPAVLGPRKDGEGEGRFIPIPPHAEEPLSIRRMRTMTDEDDGGLLQNAEKELRESGMLKSGSAESQGSEVTVELKKLDMTIKGPINCVLRFCKEMTVISLMKEEANPELFGDGND
jgi:hypothetical protein